MAHSSVPKQFRWRERNHFNGLVLRLPQNSVHKSGMHLVFFAHYLALARAFLLVIIFMRALTFWRIVLKRIKLARHFFFFLVAPTEYDLILGNGNIKKNIIQQRFSVRETCKRKELKKKLFSYISFSFILIFFRLRIDSTGNGFANSKQQSKMQWLRIEYWNEE